MMLNKMTLSLARAYYAQSGTEYDEDDIEVYSYGLQIFLSNVFEVLAVLIIGLCIGRFFETVAFFVSFISLRSGAGGYHAKTYLRCFLGLLVVYGLHIGVLMLTPTAVIFYVPLGILALSVFPILRYGVLNIGDEISISSVRLAGQTKSEFFNVEAVVKSIREELDIIEGVKEIDSASKGSIVGVDLKEVYSGRKKIHKKDVKISRQSIGFSSEETFEQQKEFYIRFSDASAVIDILNNTNQDVILFWFGKRVAAKVVEIPNSLDGMVIQLLSNMKLAIPNSSILKSEIIKNTKMITYHQGEMHYIKGLIEFDKCTM